MKVERNHVVSFHYELTDAEGDALESSRERKPLAVLQGHGNVVRGLDFALLGRTVGERFAVTVSPEDGYGLRREGWTQRVSKKHFPDPRRLKPGQQTAVRSAEGFKTVTVLKVGSKIVDVDLNHPMAGVELHFEVEIVDIREAAREELAHGHAHEPGGHAHEG